MKSIEDKIVAKVKNWITSVKVTDFIQPKVEYNVIIKPDKIIPYKLLIFKIYSKTLPAIFNCLLLIH